MNVSEILKKHEEDIDKCLLMIKGFLVEKIGEKGDKPFASPHEFLGALTEEYMELIDSIRENSGDKIAEETLDVLVSSIWGLMSNIKGWGDPNGKGPVL